MAKYKNIDKLEIEDIDGTMIDITNSAAIRGCFDPNDFIIECDLPDGVDVPFPLVGHAEITVSFDAGQLERFFAKPKFTLRNVWRRFLYWIERKN